MSIVNDLKELSLDEKEIKLYLAALKLGSSTMSELASESKIKRATTYIIIEQLIKKNLLKKTKLNKKYVYSPENLDVLKVEVEKKRYALDRILPYLNDLLTQQSGRPDVQILEGKEGILKIYEEAFAYKELLFWSDIDQLAKLLGKDFQKALDQTEAKGINVRDIVGDTPFGRRYAKNQNKKSPRHQTKILKGEVFKNDNMIYGNTFVIFSIQKDNIFAVKITSKEISQTYRIFFQSLWERV